MGDAELQLIIEACRSTFAGQVPATALASPGIRWDRLVTLSRRHRVQGLVCEGLQPVRHQIPCEYADRLREEAEGIIRANLLIAAESVRLLDHFLTADLDLLFLKGLALGALAYRNPYLKMGWDIDLLIAPGDLNRACQLMRSAGYTAAIPENATDRQLAKWHDTRKESVWRTADGSFYVDLHTRLADNPAMLRTVGMGSPRQVAKLGNKIGLPTLGPEELFAYLSVHGASSAWFRLKWAADLAALLSTRTGDEIEHLHDRSQQLGAGRAAAQALLLIDDLFEVVLDPRFRSRLEADRLNLWLARSAQREIYSPIEPTERPLGTAMIHLTQLAMMPGARFAVSEARRQFHDVTNRLSADHQVTSRA